MTSDCFIKKLSIPSFFTDDGPLIGITLKLCQILNKKMLKIFFESRFIRLKGPNKQNSLQQAN